MTEAADHYAVQDLLDFWFADETKARWYDSTRAFDETCRKRFGDLHERAAQDQLADWQNTAEGALALCLLLDQIPRNIFRASPKAFESDAKAVRVATAAIEQGLDKELESERRAFLYLPFMHSEELADQERSIDLNRSLDNEDSLAYAKDHADIIRRFGRFPHRNAILGRDSTNEELAFLADGAKNYGQSTE